MTRATNAKRRSPAEITLTVLPRLEPAERMRARRGETISNFVKRSGWQARGLPIVCARIVAGDMRPVLRKDWSLRIKPSDQIVFLSQPLDGGGGGSRSVGALLATIAVITLATLVAGPGGFLASAGFGATALAVTSALIIAGGSFLISHFLAPKSGAKSKDGDDPLSISLSGNKARPQQPIPVHYGRLKFNPDFASPPWADYSGQDQTFHGLYCLGAGEFSIEEIGISGTPVWTAADGTLPDFPTFKYQVAGPGEPVTLFPTNVAVSPDVTGQELPTPSGGTQYVGPFIVNPPASVGQEVAIDLLWPGGSFTMEGTNTRPASTTVIAQYRMISDTGVPIGGTGALWITAFSQTYTMETKVAVRKTEKFSLPNAGRVQIRVGRTDAVITSNGTNSVVWGGARLYLQGGNSRPKVTQLAIEIVADKQLSQYNSQQIYVIATRKIPVWTGTAWDLQATQNPVWAAVDMWHHPDYGGNQSRDNIDLPTMAAKAADADARGDTFNHRFVAEATVLDALTTILRSMLAQPVYVWDRFSMIRDEPRLLPRILLTDFEIIRGSPSIVYTLQDDQTSDGTIVEYLEEELWSRADVASAASLADLIHPARVQIEGVTNRRQATLIARYLAAVNRYRRVVLSLDIEAEGKLLRRGDLVAVQTEMPGTWGQSFRVDAYNLTARSLTFHAPATWGTGNHYVRLKAANGASFGPVLVTQGATADIAILSATDLATVEAQQGMLLSDVLGRSDVSEMPSAAFSIGQPREFLGLVTRLSNGGEGRFSLDLVNDAPEVYEIDDSSVPPLPDAPTLTLPAVPGMIVGLFASLTQSGLTLTLSAAWQPDPSAQTYTAQVSLDNGETWSTIYPAGYDSAFQVAGFGDRDLLLQIRGVTAAGNNGPWTQVLVTTPGLILTTDALGIGVSPGTIDALSFASSLTAVGIVAGLPNPTGYTGVILVYNTADNQLYKYVSGAWTPAAVAEIAANSITAGMIQAGAIKAAAIDVTVLSAISSNVGTITAGTVKSSDGKFEISLDGGYLRVAD
ncbi:MAG: hypothetical protein JWM36_4330 [Hyphomicrobiales bacterium]|nr:hypothetical protein [Hyphomicrobiales bacterium]